MKKNIRITWLMLVAFVVTIFGGFTAPAAAAGFNDINGHWAQSQIETLAGNGVITGYPDQTFKPDNKVTRAEFITMANRAFSFSESADISYPDVQSGDWFYKQVGFAKAVGYIAGYEDGTMRPNNQISRQEVAKIVAVIKKLDTTAGDTGLNSFNDKSSIPAWSSSYVAAMVKAGYISGYPDRTFKAANSITRAEAAKILFGALGLKVEVQSTFDKAGTYGPQSGTQTIDKDVTISADGVILQNTTIDGDLLISSAVGEGDVTLTNVEVTGTTTINGGGENSIDIEDCDLGTVKVNKSNDKIRLVLSGTTKISSLVLDSGAKIVGSGTITKATINASGVEIEQKPGKTTVKRGVTAKVNGKSVSGSSGGGGHSSGGSSPTQQVVASVTATQGSVDQTTLQIPITLSTTTQNATIYYTINGSNPTTASPEYDGFPILVNSPATVKAIATKTEMKNSSVATFTYNKLELTSGADDPYGPEVSPAVQVAGDVILSGTGLTSTTLQNIVVAGDLSIDVGKQGSVTLKNVTVQGNTNIISAAPDTVTFISCAVSTLNISATTDVRIVAGEGTTVTQTTVAATSNVTLETTGTGSFDGVDVESDSPTQEITLKGTFGSVGLSGSVATQLTVAADSTVQSVTTSTTVASTITAADGATITTIEAVTEVSVVAPKGVISTIRVVVGVTVSRSGGSEEEDNVVKVTPPPVPANITVTNTIGNNDTVTITDLTNGDTIKLYDAAIAGNEIATATVPDSGVVEFTGLDLGSSGGYIWATAKSEGNEESSRMKKSFTAEPTSTKPAASPASGLVVSGTTVVLSAATGANIYYTTNGDDPTTSSTQYTTPIAITADTTLKAVAAETGKNISPVMTAYFTVMQQVATPKLVSTNAVGANNGVVYKQYKLMDGDTPINLSSDNVKSISVVELGGEAKALTPDSDTTIWFNVDKAAGNYKYKVVANDNTVYIATLAWEGPAAEAVVSFKTPTGAEAAFTAATGEAAATVDFRNITADKALDWTSTEAGYYAIELQIAGVDLSAENVVKAIRVYADGTSEEPQVSGDLDAQYVTTKWQTGESTMYYVLADNSIYKAVIKVASLDFAQVVEPTEASLVTTNAVGANNGVVYKQYKLMNGETQINLSSDNVKSISVVELGGEAKALTPDSDTTLWFNVDKAAGSYEYTVVANDDTVYTATLVWAGPAVEAEVSFKAPTGAEAAFTAATETVPATVDFRSITADKALDWTSTEAGYYAIELQIAGVDLSAENVDKAIRVYADGTSEEPEVSGGLNAQYVTTKWQTGESAMYYVLADNTIHKAVINVVSLDFAGVAPVEADLTTYTTVLAAAVEADYTAESWTIYQVVVAANVVTTANTQAEVDAATAAIVTAQGDLVTVPSQAAIDLANQMDETYAYLESADKTQVGNVRTALNALTDAELDGVIAPLINTKVVDEFTSATEAKKEIREFVRGFGQIYYSADKTELAGTLDQFKEDNTALFTNLFGSDITADQLYSLLIAAQDELPTVIQDSDNPLDLFTKTDAEIKTLWPTYAKAAIRSAIQKQEFTDFYGKLGAIDWSAEDLIDQQNALSALIDTNHNTELVLGKAYIRSQTALVPEDATSGKTTLAKNETTTYKLTIMGLGSSTAAAKVSWSSSDTDVASFDSNVYENKLTAKSVGTTEITVYRDVTDATPENDWILKFTVTVE